MKVAFLGQSGPYAPWGLRELLAQDNPFEIAVVVEGRKFPVARQTHRWVAAKPRPLPAAGDESLVDLASAAGIEVLQTADVNAAYVCAALVERRIDALVCVGYDRLFAPPLLACAPRLALNAHPSRLPQLRGPAPLFWLLRQGARTTAVTLHGLDAHEDHGPIYAQGELAIPPRVSGEVLYNMAGRLAGALLRQALSQATTGTLCGVPQDHGQASRAPRPQAEDAFVEPNLWDCTHLVNFACGTAYFRAAWLRLGGDTFHVKSGVQAEVGRRMPAEYVLKGDLLVVQCRDGLAHLQIQT